MINVGKVISVQNEKVDVLVKRSSSCGENCASCNACTNKQIQVTAYCDFKVSPGETVEIRSDTVSVIMGLVTLFILPIIIPLIAYLLLSRINNIFSVVMASILEVLTLFFIYLMSKNKRYLNKLTPRVIKVINN